MVSLVKSIDNGRETMGWEIRLLKLLSNKNISQDAKNAKCLCKRIRAAIIWLVDANMNSVMFAMRAGNLKPVHIDNIDLFTII